jgi:hypothetical protein
MNELPPEVPDAWFYTREGERCGPVTLAELRLKATEGGLNPRLDLVWTQGMTDWKPAGEIDALFERRISETPAASAYALPDEESVGDQMRSQGEWPGTRRRGYLAASILVPLAGGMVLQWVPTMLGTPLDPEWMDNVNLGGSLLIFIIVLHFNLERLLNVGMSRWWFLGNFVPLLNLWVGYRCFACPAGYAYHKKLDGIGVALAIIYWLMILVAIVAAIGLVILLVNYANDPRLAEPLRQMLKMIRDSLGAHPAFAFL